MQSGSVWKFRDIRVKFPETPYIDSVYNLWCGKLYHVENYYVNGKKFEWTSKEKLFPYISKYGYGVLEEVTLNVQDQSMYYGFFGDDATPDDVARYWNSCIGDYE